MTVMIVVVHETIRSENARQASTDGSVVEFSPATREARVRFPVSAYFFFFLLTTLCALCTSDIPAMLQQGFIWGEGKPPPPQVLQYIVWYLRRNSLAGLADH